MELNVIEKGANNNTSSDADSFRVVWEDLNCVVDVNQTEKTILSDFSGSVRNGEIAAILGPSGAGKSTFLNCLAGKQKLRSGTVRFKTRDQESKQVSFAYVPQIDDLTLYLTVEESLILASKLKNNLAKLKIKSHEELVKESIEEFDLTRCAKTFVRNCSGGEAKRLSIALELISFPNILVLDEPTSGLDSTTALKCISVLKARVQHLKGNQQAAVLATIHQPNSDLFHSFDKVFFLASGMCVYSGAPENLVPHLGNHNLECPMYYNPADYILQVIGHEGERPMLKYLHKVYKADQINVPGANDVGLHEISQKDFKGADPDKTFLAYLLLTRKFFLSSFRDPLQLLFRFFLFMVFPFSPLLLNYTRPEDNYCVFVPKNETHILTENLYQREDRFRFGIQRSNLLYFNLLALFMASTFHDNMIFSSYVNVFLKEYRNRWYTLNTFFFAFITVTITSGVVYASLNAIVFYTMSETEFHLEKALALMFVCIVAVLIGDTLGLAISIMNPRQMLANMLLGVFVTFSTQFFSGFLIRIRNMAYITKLISNGCAFKYMFEMSFRVLYMNPSCIIANDKIFQFEYLIDFIDFYNFETNDNLEVIEKIPLKIKASLRQNPWNKDSMFELAAALNGLEEDGIARLEHFWRTKVNYVIEAYDFEIASMSRDITALVLLTIAHFLLCYLLLVVKTRKLR